MHILKFAGRHKREMREFGMTVAEVIVAAVIIISTLLFSAGAFNNVFDAQTTTETRNRAVAIAQDRIAKTQMTHFRDLGFNSSQMSTDRIAGGLGGITEYNGEKIRTLITNPNTSLDVNPYEEEVVGKTNLTVTTYITKVQPNTFDGTSKVFIPTLDIAPARVSVIVEWNDKTGTQKVVRSIIRYPSTNECAPVHSLTNTTATPEGCKVN